MVADNKVLSYDEVSLHNTSKDCWVIINAKAYDVTNFLDDHPGGEDVLLGAAGQDASEEFENAGHGSAARLMLDEYYVGEIDLSTKNSSSPLLAPAAATADSTPEVPKDDKGASSALIVKLVQFLLILGLAAGIHFFIRSSSNSVH